MSARKGSKPAAPILNAPENTTARLLLRLSQQFAVLLLAVLGYLFCLLTSYSLDLPTGTLLWTAVAFSLLFLAVFTVKRSGLLALICLLIGIFWIWFRADELLQGALLLVQQAVAPLSLNLPQALIKLLQPVDAAHTVQYMTHAAQALLFFVSFLAGYFIIQYPSVPGLALSTLPTLLPAPFYLLSPSIPAFFTLFAAHLMVFAFNNAKRAQSTLRVGAYIPQSKRKADLSVQRATQQSLSLLVLPLIVLAALLSGIVLPQKGYQRPEIIEQLQQKIFSLNIDKDTFWRSNDGLTRGDLTSLSSIRFSGDPVLQVRVSEPYSLYLRDYAGSLYTKDGWANVSAGNFATLENSVAGIAPQNLLAAATALQDEAPSTFSLSVRNIDATPMSIWSPPGLVTQANEIVNAGYVQDTALAFTSSIGSTEYSLEAIPVGMALYSVSNADDGLQSAYQAAAGSAYGLKRAKGDEAERVQQAARSYIDYIFSVYTTLPDDTRAAAETLLQTYDITRAGEDGSLNLAATCQQIHQLFAERCSYDYSPPQVPEGVDFATWFLQDAQRGYCVHFATTATVLLRALGIPARYAEGYIVIQPDYEKQADADGFINIEDTHAHAWVEVYDPAQLEWVPVEMTINSSDEKNPTPDPNGDEQGEPTVSLSLDTPEPTPEPTPTPTPTPSPTPTPNPETAETSANPDETPSETADGTMPEITPTPAPSDGGTQDGEAPAEESSDSTEVGSATRPPLWPVLAIVAAIGTPLTAFGLRKAAQEKRTRRFLQKDVNAGVLAASRYALDMLQAAGAQPMQPSDSPESYARAVARKLPLVDAERLAALLLTAERASFSGRVCTKRERDEAIAFGRTLAGTLPARMKRFKRFSFWWRFPAE